MSECWPKLEKVRNDYETVRYILQWHITHRCNPHYEHCYQGAVLLIAVGCQALFWFGQRHGGSARSVGADQVAETGRAQIATRSPTALDESTFHQRF
jgi:hypothetical protein